MSPFGLQTPSLRHKWQGYQTAPHEWGLKVPQYLTIPPFFFAPLREAPDFVIAMQESPR